MATISTHELAYDVEKLLERRFKSLRIPKPKQVAEDVTPDIIRMIPSEAFDPKQPWSTGAVFFHADVEESNVIEAQYELLAVHHNTAKEQPITLYLSSFGGDCYAGFALISTIQEIRRSGRRVNCHIQGCAMSMGSLVAQVCDIRTIEPQAWMMIHEIATRVPWGKTSEIRDEADLMERLELQTFALYSARSGKPVEYWRKKFHRRDVHMTAEEALSDNLVDEIASTPPYPRKRKPKAA